MKRIGEMNVLQPATFSLDPAFRQAQELLQWSELPYAEAEAIPSLANCHVLLGEPASEVLNRRRQLLRDLGARAMAFSHLIGLSTGFKAPKVDFRQRISLLFYAVFREIQAVGPSSCVFSRSKGG